MGESTDVHEGAGEGTNGCRTENGQDAEERDGEEESVGRESSRTASTDATCCGPWVIPS